MSKVRIKSLFAMMLALVLSFSVSVAAFAETSTKENEKALEEYYKALAKQQGTVLPISMNVTVKDKKYKVGDKLSAKDFTVTINMSDGSKVKNPAGWTANPLALTTESTEITVAYNGLTTKVTVKANAAAKQPEQTTQPETPKPEAKRPYPDSAYRIVDHDAIEDLYNYASDRGYNVVVEKVETGSYIRMDGGDSSISVVHFADGTYMDSYWNSTDDSRQGGWITGQTLEHIYKHMFP